MDLAEKLQIAYQKLKQASNVLIVGHLSPDIDALASIGAITETLNLLGVKNQSYASGKLPGSYDFIPNIESIGIVKPTDLQVFDVIIILDCGSISRTNLEPELLKVLVERQKIVSQQPFIIEFDHHEPQDKFSDLEIRLSGKASTTEIIYDFLQINRLPITRKIADCILAGLLADTGNFIHANSSVKALVVSSKLLLKGSSFSKISQQIRSTGNLAVLKIWGKSLENIKFNLDTGFACTALTTKELKELFKPEDRADLADVFSDVVSFLSYLPGVKVALLLREEDGKIKGSLRANNGEVDVAKIARSFGGGGHKRAAGFSINGNLKETDSGWKIVNGR